MLPASVQLPLEIQPQPDESTCGPTCLEAVYRYWGAGDDLREVIRRTQRFEQGGTVAVFLACDALRRGFRATIYTYNLMLFDPTWFIRGADIAERLKQQLSMKPDPRLHFITQGYLDFLELGGRLRYLTLSSTLIVGPLRRHLPIITGLSSTYLYNAPREYGPNDRPDDIRGTPSGHFVVIAGYDRPGHKVLVADPYQPNPHRRGSSLAYWVNMDRVLGSVLLGMVTHDANLLFIHPHGAADGKPHPR